MYKEFIENLILQCAVNDNILPLTSVCNMGCLFCSHRQNPPGVRVYRIPPRELDDIEEALSYMDPVSPVIIGESVTRIIEGEPFTHPYIDEILQLVRNKFAGAAIRITTNGSLLNESRVRRLADLTGVELNLSLNSASLQGRKLLMGDSQAERSIRNARLLAEYGLVFHGSVVAMPHLVGWQDIRNTVKYLSGCGAATIRIFLPGFTRLAPSYLHFAPDLLTDLRHFLDELCREVETPLLCEPPLINAFTPQVAGVLNASPAARAGIKRGDILASVDGLPVSTRVEAFEVVYKTASPLLEVVRGQDRLQLRLIKSSGESSGLVMDYDLHPGLVREIRQLAKSCRASNTLVLTGVFAAPLLRMAMEKFGSDSADIEVLAVPNRFFGGSIQAAGLLTVADFREALEQYSATNSRSQTDLVLLPGLAFDSRGFDLTGRSYLELEEMSGAAVRIIDC